jgi:hypothetical protein
LMASATTGTGPKAVAKALDVALMMGPRRSIDRVA